MLTMMKTKYHFNPVVWGLIIGTMASRFGTSMTIPFMSFFLHEKIGISLSHTGLIIGSSFLAYALGGFWGGALSDFIGRRFLLLGSLLIYSLVFILFGVTSNTLSSQFWIGIAFFFLSIVSGVCRSWYETLAQASIADLTTSNQKISAFSLRYTAINIGAACGPVIGALMGVSGSVNGFYVTGTILFSYFVIFSYFFFKNNTVTPNLKINKTSIYQAIRILIRDKAFRYIIIGGIFVYFGFVQQEALLGQVIFLKLHNIKILSLLLSLNACLVIIFQLPLSNLISKYFSHLKAMIIGAFLIALGLAGFGISNDHISFYFINEITLTIGEILIFPFMGIVVDSLAPETLRGTYFGATAFQFFGRAMGPPVGGFLLQTFGVSMSMLVIAMITTLSILFFRLAMVKVAAPVFMQDNKTENLERIKI